MTNGYYEPLPFFNGAIKPKSDIELRAFVDSSTAEVSGVFNVMLERE
jgi:hypothetical protein